jgi:hypothetical protein
LPEALRNSWPRLLPSYFIVLDRYKLGFSFELEELQYIFEFSAAISPIFLKAANQTEELFFVNAN